MVFTSRVPCILIGTWFHSLGGKPCQPNLMQYSSTSQGNPWIQHVKQDTQIAAGNVKPKETVSCDLRRIRLLIHKFMQESFRIVCANKQPVTYLLTCCWGSSAAGMNCFTHVFLAGYTNWALSMAHTTPPCRALPLQSVCTPCSAFLIKLCFVDACCIIVSCESM